MTELRWADGKVETQRYPKSKAAELRSWTGEGARPHTIKNNIKSSGQECPLYTFSKCQASR